MRRYWVEGQLKEGELFKVSGDSFTHIFKVCRLGLGQKFEILQPSGAYLVEVKEISKSFSLVLVLERRDVAPLKTPYIHLILANPKPSVLEAVLEKSVELGVKSIRLLASENSFFKNIDKVKAKQKRIDKIKTQAMQQSGRLEPLELLEPDTYQNFLESTSLKKEDRAYILYEASEEKSGFKGAETSSSVKNIYLLVGGEGGFTREEALKAKEKGFREISLGEQILRVETACVAGVSILKSKFDAW